MAVTITAMGLLNAFVGFMVFTSSINLAK
jgi:hypothetical protein